MPHVEVFQHLNVAAVARPCLTAEQQSWQDHSVVDLNLCPEVNPMLWPYSGVQASECSAGSADAIGDVQVDGGFRAQDAAKICEMPDRFQNCPVDVDLRVGVRLARRGLEKDLSFGKAHGETKILGGRGESRRHSLQCIFWFRNQSAVIRVEQVSD